MTVAITRLGLSSADLREAAARTPDAKAARRILAIALLLEGWSREAAAEACAMERQTLRDWVHRYNEAGLDGLRPRDAEFRTEGAENDVDHLAQPRCGQRRSLGIS